MVILSLKYTFLINKLLLHININHKDKKYNNIYSKLWTIYCIYWGGGGIKFTEYIFSPDCIILSYKNSCTKMIAIIRVLY